MSPEGSGEVRWRELGLVGLLFVLLTLVLAAPLSLSPATTALPLSADTRLFLWTISWDVHALLTQPLQVFDANIFFPEPRTLAYSEHLIGSALLGAPALLATGNPVLALNVIVLLSCVLSGLGAWYLARRLDVGTLGALAAGIVFAFGPARFVRLAQVHVAVVQWIPFALAFMHLYARHRRRRDLVLVAVFFTVQSLSSGHGGLFLTLALGALILYLWAFDRLPGPVRMLRDLGIAGVLILAVNVVFLVPYLRAQHDVGLHRTIGAVYAWVPNAVSFLAAPTHVQEWLLSLLPSLQAKVADAKAYLFPGWITLALAALAFGRRGASSTPAPPAPRPAAPQWLKVLDGLLVLVALATLTIHVEDGIRWTLWGAKITAHDASRAFAVLAVLAVVRLAAARLRPFAFASPLGRLRDALRRFLEARTGIDAGFYVVLAVLSVWLCLGPDFVLYKVLYRVLPGFDLIRVPSRLGILTLLALGVLAGIGLDRLVRGLEAPRGAWVGAAAIVLLVGELAAFPLDARPYGIDVPAIDRELAARAKPFAAVGFPVPDPTNATQSARVHSYVMLHSMEHWQPMVNGYSGIVPPRHQRLYMILTAFPDTASLRELEELGVSYAVLHREFYSAEDWAARRGAGGRVPGPAPPRGRDRRRPPVLPAGRADPAPGGESSAGPPGSYHPRRRASTSGARPSARPASTRPGAGRGLQ